MIIKKHISQGKLILAVCDASLLNKKIETDTQILDLSSNFFKGEKATKEELLDLIKKGYLINAVGKKTIGCLIENKIITKRDTKEIQNIPHVQLIFE